jgi:hypothetical protein
MLEEARDREEIIERVAALDIAKAEMVVCVRVPGSKERLWGSRMLHLPLTSND